MDRWQVFHSGKGAASGYFYSSDEGRTARGTDDCGIFAGEAAGVESIEKAIRLGAKRIGHGTAAIQSEELMRKLAEEGIPLECCPTSNAQTKSIERYENHPINVFLQKGINATLNTDNRTVSGIKLSEEFKKAQDQFGLTDEQLVILIKNSIDASFYNQRLQLQNRNNYKKEEIR